MINYRSKFSFYEVTMSRKEFYNLFVDLLNDIYSGENQLIDVLPHFAEASTNPNLKKAFTHHLKETKEQKKRLDEIYHKIGEHPGDEKCEAMEGLVAECSECIKRYKKSPIRDAALIRCAQCVEHYEIANYGTLRAFAKELNRNDIADIVQHSLDEEGEANKTLNAVAEGGIFTSGVNDKALNS